MKKLIWVLVALILIIAIVVTLIFVLPREGNLENNNDGEILVNGEVLNKENYDEINLSVKTNYIYPCTEDILYLESEEGTLYFYNIPQNTYYQIALDKDIEMSRVIELYGEKEIIIEVIYAGAIETKSILTVDYTNANLIEEISTRYENSNIILSEDKTKIAYERDNCLYYSDLNGENEQMLLEGTVGGEAESVGYNPIKFIDETRILYHSGAWEGSIGFGIIDTETLANTFYNNGLSPIGYEPETNTAYCVSAYSSLDSIEKVNIEDGSETEVLDLVLLTGNYYAWEWNESDLSKIIMVKEDDEQIEIYDINTEELIYTIALNEGSLNNLISINDTIFIDYYKVPDENYEDAEYHLVRIKL